jgi:hypothetical protein
MLTFTRSGSRSLIQILLGLMLVLTLGTALASEKRGVGLWDRDRGAQLALLHASWYYTWSPYPMRDPVAATFVPMVWGGRDLQTHIQALDGKPPVPVLLALNEPDKPRQASMTVQQAVDVWPILSRLATRISSPATADPLGGWAAKFEKRARVQGLRTDFIAVHLYGPPDAQQFLKQVDQLHRHYGKPIWITEFAVADWDAKTPGSNRYSAEQVMDFMKAVIPELEKRPYVERYAWFGAGRGYGKEAVRTSLLVDPSGALTPLGRLYASF